MPRPRDAALLALVVVASLGACGERTAPEPEGPAVTSARWSEQPLSGTPAVDFPSVLVGDVDRGVLALFLADDGTLVGNVSTDGTDFTAGPSVDLGTEWVALGGAAPFDGGWFALGSGGRERVDGDDAPSFEAIGLRSPDGLSWESVEVTGFTGPVEVNDVAVLDGRLIAVGTYRTAADPSSGGFVAAVWTSDDGTAWREVELPGVGGGDSYLGEVAVSGERLVVAGRTGSGAGLWTSGDGGDTWSGGDVSPVAGAGRGVGGGVGDGGGEGPFAVSGLEAVGDTVVLTTAEGAVGRSVDGGLTWAPAQSPPPSLDVEGYAPLWVGGGRFFTVTSVMLDVYVDLGLCYVDPEQGCPNDSELDGLYTSPDGETWERVDTDAGGGPGGQDGEVGVDSLVGAPDGGLVVLGRTETGEPAVRTWPADVALPTEPEPTLPSAEITEVPRSGPEVGIRYAVPIYLHCGSEWLYLHDTPWRRVGPEWSDGREGSVFGFATLATPERLEYADGSGRVVATYELTGAQPPGCD